jgi:hypothetical protein
VSAAPRDAVSQDPRRQSRLSLTWNPIAPAVQGFVVERKSGDGEYRIIKRLASGATTWVDETVAAGTTYCYRVRSYNAAGGSDPSKEACGTAPSPEARTAPSPDAPASAVRSGAPALAPGSPPSGTLIALHDVARLVGRWQGDVRTTTEAIPVTVVFKADGTAEWVIRGTSRTATYVLEGGRIRWRAANLTATGSMYDDAGQRILRLDCDDGTCRSELVPKTDP